MSEYQYYEFQAIDRPLTKDEMADLRALSTRATITPTHFQNVYHWGDFKGNPLTLMERYFDAFVYVANWGTHWFMLRLPREALDPEVAAQYCVEDGASAHVTGDHVILDFRSEDEAGDFDETGEEWLPALIPLRAELAGGDLRALYLGWLRCAQTEMLDDDQVEPPVPPGLGRLSGSLSALAEFLRLDDDLIAVATEGSADHEAATPSASDLEQWIHALPEAEKDALLLRLAGGAPHVRAEMLRRFRETKAPADPPDRQASGASGGGRTVSELLSAAEERAETRRRQQAEREARERAHRERAEAAARAAYLDDLAQREAEVWRQLEALVETKRPTDYERAAGLAKDLHDLSLRKQTARAFEARLSELRARHAKKPSFLRRLDAAGLPRGSTGE